MKKILLIVIMLLMFVGCQNINKIEPYELTNYVLSNYKSMYNQYRKGYKFYMPRGVEVSSSKDNNEHLTTTNTNYYLYVDLIGYYNKTDFTYNINNEVYLSKEINYNNIKGYIEIKKNNDNFYVEMMYNYAKIELVTDSYYLNEDVYRGMIILSTLTYNDAIINNLMGENVLDFKETTYNVYKPNDGVQDFLDYVDEYNTYDGSDTEIPDYDVIN